MNSTAFWWSMDYAQVHIVTLSGVHDFKNGYFFSDDNCSIELTILISDIALRKRAVRVDRS